MNKAYIKPTTFKYEVLLFLLALLFKSIGAQYSQGYNELFQKNGLKTITRSSVKAFKLVTEVETDILHG